MKKKKRKTKNYKNCLIFATNAVKKAKTMRTSRKMYREREWSAVEYRVE